MTPNVWALVALFAAGVFTAVYMTLSEAWQLRGSTGIRAAEGLDFLETLSPFIAAFRPLGVQTLRSMPSKDIEALQTKLRDAGLHTEIAVEEFCSLRFVGAAGGCAMGLMFGVAGLGLSPMTGAAVVLLTIMGYAYPVMWLNHQARQRKERVFRGLSNTLDVLSISVQAGLEIREALERVVRIGSEPVLDRELSRTLEEINKGGKTLSQAFEDLRERVNTPEMTAFCNVILMAFQLGAAGVGNILAEQADAIRTERVLRAERITAELPSKILFPIAVFIFPAVLVTILGPLGLRAYIEFSATP